ncbi:MAG TPA: sulfotransferase domain-containing protein [Desulfobacteraceae bacterium]|nr:sulfotransferase domain-containing protein [Desulfobacteraceae bacterium]HPJ66397.1 sulfotransferase domain-containing protein [Desulfobacteraceae bacterium]HPQ27319.1 sulfotransferase domain-containing protein [Desulfobacteraceae bacterium]
MEVSGKLIKHKKNGIDRELVLSGGMPKSGSAYVYNLINDLMIAAGHMDAREIKRKYGLHSFIMGINNRIGRLYIWRILRLVCFVRKEGSFVVKTHSCPGPTVMLLNHLGLIRIIYIYRDPRDVLISAVDHGKKLLSRGKNYSFAKMVEFDDSLKNVMKWLRIWKVYSIIPGILMIRYEDLMNNPVETVEGVSRFLGFDLDHNTLESIVWKYSRDNPEWNRKGMHFNKAIAFRYKTEMPAEQQKICSDKMGGYLEKMGYEK